MSSKQENILALIIFAAALLAGALGYGVTGYSEPEEAPIRILYESKGGLVVFDHRAHSDLEGVDCVTCHHYYEGDGRPENCVTCHEENEIPRMEAYHEKGEDYEDDDTYSSCMSCHTAKEKDSKNCKGCHK